MRAAFLSIGDELVEGQAPELNASWLAAQLAEHAVDVVELRVVPDDRAAIASAIRELAARCDVLIATGGLGPTPDDLTRFALGDVVAPGRELVTDEAALARLERVFARHALPMPLSNLGQTQHPVGTRMLPNPRGTAPGIAARVEGTAVFCLPGPPAEMQPMFAEQVVPQLAVPRDLVCLRGRVHAYGLGESAAAQRLGEITDRGREPRVGFTVSRAVLTARIRAGGAGDEAKRELDSTCRRILELWAPYAYGTDGESLASGVGALLVDARRTLAAAESCTGGWLGKTIVDVPGSSAYFLGGWVTYSDALKTSCLGVPAKLLAAHGAVSAPVAKAMAEGALSRSGARESLAITGVAGPEGPTADKPVGVVFIGLAREIDGRVVTETRRFRFPGDRAAIRDRSVKSALQMLRFALLGVEGDVGLLWQDPEACRV